MDGAHPKYGLELKVGTPAQKVTALVDTGSDGLVLPSQALLGSGGPNQTSGSGTRASEPQKSYTWTIKGRRKAKMSKGLKLSGSLVHETVSFDWVHLDNSPLLFAEKRED